MKKYAILPLLFNLLVFNFALASTYRIVDYKPLSQEECLFYQRRLGLKYCPHDDDHLAGAALACGHINNLPSPDELLVLGRKIYNSHNSQILRGLRDDQTMKDMHIWVNEKRIFYWTNHEAEENQKLGEIRMFDHHISLPYYALRDGSAYLVTDMKYYNELPEKRKKYKINKTKYKFPPAALASSNNDSNLYNHSNYDALLAICISNYSSNHFNQSSADYVSTDKDEPNLYTFTRKRSCAILCGKGAEYLKSKRHQGSYIRFCMQDPSQNIHHTCSRHSGTYKNVEYVCECP